MGVSGDMQDRTKSMLKIVPGFAVAVAIALVSRFIEGLLPIHLIGASVIALFIGKIGRAHV